MLMGATKPIIKHALEIQFLFALRNLSNLHEFTFALLLLKRHLASLQILSDYLWLTK